MIGYVRLLPIVVVGVIVVIAWQGGCVGSKRVCDDGDHAARGRTMKRL